MGHVTKHKWGGGKIESKHLIMFAVSRQGDT